MRRTPVEIARYVLEYGKATQCYWLNETSISSGPRSGSYNSIRLGKLSLDFHGDHVLLVTPFGYIPVDLDNHKSPVAKHISHNNQNNQNNQNNNREEAP